MMQAKVHQAIAEAIDDLNVQLSDQSKLTASPETLLYGMDAQLDSLDLVTLIVTVEQKIEDSTGRKITLANEKALSMRNSPFRSVGSLAEYALSLLQESAHV